MVISGKVTVNSLPAFQNSHLQELLEKVAPGWRLWGSTWKRFVSWTFRRKKGRLSFNFPFSFPGGGSSEEFCPCGWVSAGCLFRPPALSPEGFTRKAAARDLRCLLWCFLRWSLLLELELLELLELELLELELLELLEL